MRLLSCVKENKSVNAFRQFALCYLRNNAFNRPQPISLGLEEQSPSAREGLSVDKVGQPSPSPDAFQKPLEEKREHLILSLGPCGSLKQGCPTLSRISVAATLVVSSSRNGIASNPLFVAFEKVRI